MNKVISSQWVVDDINKLHLNNSNKYISSKFMTIKFSKMCHKNLLAQKFLSTSNKSIKIPIIK